jgi:DNA-binding response OmpR family regulator
MTSNTMQNEKRILLVEDEASYRAVVLATLRKAGLKCSFCVDGDHAIKKLEQEKFDLIIVDYLLPGPNGFEIIQWARNQGIETSALLITNYPSDDLNKTHKVLEHTKILPKSAFTASSIPAIVQELLI